MDMNKIITARLSNIREKMRSEQIDALLLTSAENVSYCTLFSGDDSWALISSSKVWLITDSRYTEQAGGECLGCRIIERKGAICDALDLILKKNRSINTLGTERAISLSTYNTLEEKLSVDIKSVSNIVNNLREIKDAFEIECINKAASIARNVLEQSLTKLCRNMTESEFAGVIEFEMRKQGVKPAFDTIAAFGANGSRPHHRPGNKRLRKNDAILIDYGVKYKGYCCDITRCFAVGKATDEYMRAYRAVLDAQGAAIGSIKAGGSIAQADNAARAVIKAAALPDFGHGTGHGFGLNIHESPTVYRSSEQKFQCGQVVTVEPGVYIPGKLGIRIEDDVIVTANGCKILTRGRQYPELRIIEPR